MGIGYESKQETRSGCRMESKGTCVTQKLDDAREEGNQ